MHVALNFFASTFPVGAAIRILCFQIKYAWKIHLCFYSLLIAVLLHKYTVFAETNFLMPAAR